MRFSTPLLTIGLLLVAALVSAAPTATAQAGEALATVGSPLFQLYVADSGLDTKAPEGTASKKKTVTGTAGTPALSYWVSVGQYKFEQDVTIVSDGVITAWITSTQQTAATSFQGRVLKGATVLATGGSGNYVDTAGNRNSISATAPVRFELGLTLRGQTFSAGDTLDLQMIFFGPAYAGTPIEALLLYGSSAHPSGLSFAVAAPTGSEVSGVTPLYFDDKAFTTEPPTGTTPKKRASESAYQGQTAATIASSVAWTWGRYTTEQEIHFVGDSFVSLFLSLDGTAVTWRGLRAQLYFGSTLVDDTDVGIRPTAYQSASAAAAVTPITIGFATHGKVAEAGTVIRVDFLTWSSTGPAGSLTFLYGSANRPAALVLAAGPSVGASTPSLLLSADTTELRGEQGATATGVINITNAGLESVNVTFNVTSSLPVDLAPGPHMVGGNNSTLLEFQVDLAEAVVGDTYAVTLHALLDGVEIGNLTYNVTVDPAPGPSVSPTDAGTTTATSNATANQASDNGAPGPGVAGLVAVLLGAAYAARRRRGQA